MLYIMFVTNQYSNCKTSRDGRCFLAGAASKSVYCCLNDRPRPKPKPTKTKGCPPIPMFSVGLLVGKRPF